MPRRHRRDTSATTNRWIVFAASILAVVVWLLAPWPAGAQAPAPAPGPAAGAPTDSLQRPTDEMMHAVENEGRRIASYHEAIAKARARAREHNPALLEGGRMVVVARSGTWHVVLLRQETAGGAAKGWMAAADAVFAPNAGELSAFQVFDPLRPPPGDALAASRALETARTKAMQSVPGGASFEEAMFREAQGPWTVYLQRKSETQGTTRIGGDFVAVVGPDGQQLTDFKPIHDKAVAGDVPIKPGGAPTLHSHPIGDLPTATDVAMVIEHPALVPHLVLTPRWMFRIESGGTLTWLGSNAVPPVTPGGGR